MVIPKPSAAGQVGTEQQNSLAVSDADFPSMTRLTRLIPPLQKDDDDKGYYGPSSNDAGEDWKCLEVTFRAKNCAVSALVW